MIASFSVGHLLVLVLAIAYLGALIWTIVSTISDSSISTPDKVGWLAVVLIIPVLGLVVWLIVRALARRRRLRAN